MSVMSPLPNPLDPATQDVWGDPVNDAIQDLRNRVAILEQGVPQPGPSRGIGRDGILLSNYAGWNSTVSSGGVTALKAAITASRSANTVVFVPPFPGAAGYQWQNALIDLTGTPGVRLVSTSGIPATEFIAEPGVVVAKTGTSPFITWGTLGETRYVYFENILFQGSGLATSSFVKSALPAELSDFQMPGCSLMNYGDDFWDVPLTRTTNFSIPYSQSVQGLRGFTFRGADNIDCRFGFIAGYQPLESFHHYYNSFETSHVAGGGYHTPTPGGSKYFTGNCNGLVIGPTINNGLSKQAGREGLLAAQGAASAWKHNIFTSTDETPNRTYWSDGTTWYVFDNGVDRSFAGAGNPHLNYPATPPGTAAGMFVDTSKSVSSPLRFHRYGGDIWPYWSGVHFGTNSGRRVYNDGASGPAYVFENGNGDVLLYGHQFRLCGQHPFTTAGGIARKGVLQVRNWDGTITVVGPNIHDFPYPANGGFLTGVGKNPLGLVHYHAAGANSKLVIVGGGQYGPRITLAEGGATITDYP